MDDGKTRQQESDDSVFMLGYCILVVLLTAAVGVFLLVWLTH